MMLGAIIGTIVIVLVTIAIGMRVENKTAALNPPPSAYTEVRRSLAHRAGEAPATAIRAGDAQLANLRAGQRCPACRAELTYTAGSDDRVRYDERDLQVLRFACPRCGTTKSLYVEPTGT